MSDVQHARAYVVMTACVLRATQPALPDFDQTLLRVKEDADGQISVVDFIAQGRREREAQRTSPLCRDREAPARDEAHERDYQKRVSDELLHRRLESVRVH